MSSQPKIHTELLQRQLAELFRAVNDRGIHRTKFNDFKPLVVNEVEGITYSHDFLDEGKQRSRSTITVELGSRRFFLHQNYNFGVMLSQHTYVLLKEDLPHIQPHLLTDYVEDESIDEELRRSTLIEFEYAISLATESIATNLAMLE